ncbi:MAG TPA: MarP family serine protease [Candidatus Limnocylindria bacterium]|nr:MarP family serine protease [Candidatus Limnocylindria bacterium]
MNPFDLLILFLLALGAFAGWRAGFLGPVLALGGGIVGFVLALLLATFFRADLAAIEQPTRALVTLMGLGVLVLAGEAIGGALGATASRGLHTTWFRPLDALGGAVVGVAHVVLLVWLLGGLLAAGMSPTLSPVARDSAVLRAVYDRLPPPATVAGEMLALLSATDLPLLFAGLEPPPAAPVDLPNDAQARALAQSAIDSTARVSGTGCGAWQQVGSGFFISPTHVVTNAHVVAGSQSTNVTLGSTTYETSVVLFDPNADIAVLYAPGANAPELRLSGQAPERGTTGVALGYPGGGGLRVSPAAVTANHQVAGPNIYGEGRHQHSVVEMRAEIERGSSGGPLLVAPGVVGGVVFGESRSAADVGYAISAPSAARSIGGAASSTAAVDTGPCG